MKISIISMQRNEEDFLPTWLASALALADEVRVCNHGSTDNTGKLLYAATLQNSKLYFNWTLPSSYNQEEIMGELASWAFSAGADWVIPLDADEIIPLSRESLEVRLGRPGSWLAGLYWLPCLPGQRGGWWVAPNITSQKKTAVPKTLWPGRWDLGSHHFTPQAGPAVLFYLSDLWHFPLRSVEQARRKMSQGAKALVLRPDSGGHYNHWPAAAEALQTRNLTNGQLRLWAMSYPGPPPPVGARVPSAYQLRSWGWTFLKELPRHD